MGFGLGLGAAFEGAEYYREEMLRFVAHVKTSRAREGFGEIRLPGERMLRQLAESERNGVALDPAALQMLADIAARNGIEKLRTSE